ACALKLQAIHGIWIIRHRGDAKQGVEMGGQFRKFHAVSVILTQSRRGAKISSYFNPSRLCGFAWEINLYSRPARVALISAPMLRAGIVGLPNVGKSTLFNAVTRTRKAEAANYP